jgi:ADYC domain
MQAMRFMVCMAAVMAGACDEPDPGPLTCEADFALAPRRAMPEDDPPGNPCPPDGCGDNSPVINGVYFWELNLLSQVGPVDEPGSVKVISAHRADDVPMQLRLAADGDRLLGVDPVTDAVLAEHGSLHGTKIEVSVNGAQYEIEINLREIIQSEQFWVGPEQVPIESYLFLYRPLGVDTRPIPLCSEYDDDPNQLRALVFGGDRYDPITKKVRVGPETDGWINIACLNSAIYKMHKIGHTSAAQTRLGKVTTLNQRQAMLNAWTANVCGDGASFTQPGEPLKLAESLDWLRDEPGSYLDPLDTTETESVEAIWNESGAVCLTTPRRLAEEPTICSDLAKRCQPPVCTEEQIDSWKKYGHVITGNPYPDEAPSP